MSERLIGLDIARYLAFVGMVLVNFDIAMSYGVQSNEGFFKELIGQLQGCLLYTSPSPRDVEESRMPSSA